MITVIDKSGGLHQYDDSHTLTIQAGTIGVNAVIKLNEKTVFTYYNCAGAGVEEKKGRQFK